MKCKNCGKRKRSHNKQNQPYVCWEYYQLCGVCCAKLHPDIYSENIIRRYESSQN